MACSSCAERARRARSQTRYQVQTAAGKIIGTYTSKATADQVAKRNKDWTIVELQPAKPAQAS